MVVIEEEIIMKRYLSLLLSLCLIISLSACTHKNEPVTTTTEITTTETTISSTTEESASEAQTETSSETNNETEYDVSFSAYDWNGDPYIVVNNNVPFFEEITLRNDEDVALNVKSSENYSELDELGRCGVAYAVLGTDIMPTEERGKIGSIKPSGWHTSNYNEYPGLIDGNYLYNRCHLIAFMLAGENANERNLITGTRYMNVTGMLPFEDQVHDYMIEHPDNHVLYRVTPEFTGDNLVADGVLMEAYSIEDNGALSFCVFCYNVQPYVTIDYATGDNHIADNYIHSENTETTTESWEDNPNWYSYVLNENSKKIHRPNCSAVADMNEENKTETNRSYEELISEGYTPCKLCNPN